MVLIKLKCFYFPSLSTKNCVLHQFIQQWKSEIDNSNNVKYCNKYKTEFGIEQYLLNIKNDKLRKQLTRFRLSTHKLALYAGRFQNTILIENKDYVPFVICIK
mgnify:FL=1